MTWPEKYDLADRALSFILSATDPMLRVTIYQLPILTMENMIAGILGSPGAAILMRPQP